MSKQRQQRRRDRLFAAHPFCDQCGIGLVHPRDCIDLDGKLGIGRPDNMATFEHNVSRLNPSRWDETNGRPRSRLLCVKCNTENSKRDVRAVAHIWPVLSNLRGPRYQRELQVREHIRRLAA